VREREGHTVSDIVKEMNSVGSRRREFKRKRESGGHRQVKKRARDGALEQGVVREKACA